MKPVVFGRRGPASSVAGMAQKIVIFPEPLPVPALAEPEQVCPAQSAVILAFPQRPAVRSDPPPAKSGWDRARELIDRFEARHRASAALRRERAIRRAIELSKGIVPHRR